MIKLAAVLLISFSIFSCDNTKEKPLKRLFIESLQELYFGVRLLKDSNKFHDIFMKVLEEKITTDSATNKRVITSDTIYGWRVFTPVIDSVSQKPILDSLGQ